MARSDPQLNFRIPSELRDKLEAAAKENNRSLTGELIARLEQSLDPTAATKLSAEQVAEIALQKFLDRQGVLQRQAERGKVGPKKP